MTAGYRDFRPRDEDPNDHAAVAAMQARLEAVKADEAFRQAMLAAIAAGQECARTAVSPVAGREGAENHSWRVIEGRRLHLRAAAPSRSSQCFHGFVRRAQSAARRQCYVHVPARGERLILPEGITARRYDVRSHALRLFDQLLRPIVRLAM